MYVYIIIVKVQKRNSAEVRRRLSAYAERRVEIRILRLLRGRRFYLNSSINALNSGWPLKRSLPALIDLSTSFFSR